MLAAAVLVGCAYVLVGQRDTLALAADRLSPTRVGLSVVVAIAGTMCFARVWLALLHGFGVHVGAREAAPVFYISQLGKYVPGSVWPVVVQVQFGSRWGAPRRVVLGASILMLTTVAATGILVGALLLPWSSPSGLEEYWWLLVALVPLVVLLQPRVLTFLINRVSLWSGGTRLETQVSGGSMLRAGLWAVLAWLLLGGHLLILLTAYGRIDPLDVAAAVGGMALAWAAGLAFVPAPAGAGVREGVLVLTLGPVVGPDAALATAVASRVLLVLADITLAAVSVGLRTLRDVRVGRAARSAPGTEGSASDPGAPAPRDLSG